MDKLSTLNQIREEAFNNELEKLANPYIEQAMQAEDNFNAMREKYKKQIGRNSLTGIVGALGGAAGGLTIGRGAKTRLLLSALGALAGGMTGSSISDSIQRKMNPQYKKDIDISRKTLDSAEDKAERYNYYADPNKDMKALATASILLSSLNKSE